MAQSVFAALAVLLAWLHGDLPWPALPVGEELASKRSLAGQLLIASPTLADPRFAHAVILVVRHDQQGAMGIVINHPLGDRSLRAILEALGDDHELGASETVAIYAGGPVQPELGIVVHSSDYHIPETLDVDRGIAVTSHRQILRDIAQRRGPGNSLIAFGYAGWRKGQLEAELLQRAWFTAPSDPKLVFQEPRDKVWERALAQRTEDL